MNIELHHGVAGFYKIEAVRVDQDGQEIGRRVVADWFENLITNQGLDRLGGDYVSDTIRYCLVGSGSTAPTNGDTQLVSAVASTSTQQVSTSGAQPSAPYFGWQRKTYRFGAGVAAGNLSEVGIGWGPSGAVLFSRALIRDGSGNPTTITVLADEILDVTYELRNYPFLDGIAGSFTIGATTYTTEMRAANVTSDYGIFTGGWGLQKPFNVMMQNPTYLPTRLYAGASFGPITGEPTGATKTMSGLWNSSGSYVPGTYQRTATAKWPVGTEITNANMAFFAFGGCTTQMSISPATLSKTNAQELTITVTVSWGRYTP